MDNTTIVRKFKLFWVWHDDAHEQWLQRMAAQGLHLRGLNALGMHSFVRGAPADVAYRWDLGSQRRDPQYMQLFGDAGWEYVASTSGWHCWRKARAAGAVTEIFTDNASRIAKHQRVRGFLGLILVAQLPLMMLVVRNWRALLAGQSENFTILPAAVLWISMATVLMVLYGIARTGLRIRDLKRA